MTKVTDALKNTLSDKKVPYSVVIPQKQEVKVNITLDGSTSLSGIYICHTCKKSLLGGRLPAMAVQNGLHLPKLPDDCKLTELENNLIAQIINFQYIYKLPKSRWGATKKQMISVPVREETLKNTINQLPRLPKDAGILPVHLKRKLEYNSSHKSEYVDPAKMLRALKHLKDSGHPYYQFCDDFNLDSYKQRCLEDDKDGHRLLFDDDEENDTTSNAEESDTNNNYDGNATTNNEEEQDTISNDEENETTSTDEEIYPTKNEKDNTNICEWEDSDKIKNEHKARAKDKSDAEQRCTCEDKNNHDEECEYEETLIQLDITNDNKMILHIRKVETADYYRATISVENGLERIQAKVHGKLDEDKINEEVLEIIEEIQLDSESLAAKSKETILEDMKKMEIILDKVIDFMLHVPMNHYFIDRQFKRWETRWCCEREENT